MAFAAALVVGRRPVTVVNDGPPWLAGLAGCVRRDDLDRDHGAAGAARHVAILKSDSHPGTPTSRKNTGQVVSGSSGVNPGRLGMVNPANERFWPVGAILPDVDRSWTEVADHAHDADVSGPGGGG
ncbi:MAG: hypothetical protein QOE76_1226 [Frankiales bacterium]|nr:hypothetical protein [Frankiales bacterium]MDX6243503.1 hypothetical protein [Frankiales bacterium]